MLFFDSHAHLSDPSIFPQFEEIWTRAKKVGVTRMLNICTDSETLKLGFLLERVYPAVKNAGATTPHDVDKEGESAFPLFAEAARSGKLVAVGETGLDYHYTHSNPETQKHFLKKYLHLARDYKLPVIFHCREAFADLFSIVDVEYPKEGLAVLHCFTGTMEEAAEVIRRGWYLSLSGIVTFKKSDHLREVAKIVPLSQLLIETDTPFLAPQSHRGKPNEPSFLPETAACVAQAKGVSLEELARATFENAERLFGAAKNNEGPAAKKY